MGSAMSGEGVSHFASRTSMFSAQLLNQGTKGQISLYYKSIMHYVHHQNCLKS